MYLFYFMFFFFVKEYWRKITTAIIIEISKTKRQLLLEINNSFIKLKLLLFSFTNDVNIDKN